MHFNISFVICHRQDFFRQMLYDLEEDIL